jgi:hypothetical protein
MQDSGKRNTGNVIPFPGRKAASKHRGFLNSTGLRDWQTTFAFILLAISLGSLIVLGTLSVSLSQNYRPSSPPSRNNSSNEMQQEPQTPTPNESLQPELWQLELWSR